MHKRRDGLTFGDWNPVEETLQFTFFDGPEDRQSDLPIIEALGKAGKLQ